MLLLFQSPISSPSLSPFPTLSWLRSLVPPPSPGSAGMAREAGGWPSHPRGLRPTGTQSLSFPVATWPLLRLRSSFSFHLPIPPTLPSSSSSILQEAMGNCKGARGAEGRKGLPKPGRGNVVRRDKQAVQRAGWQGCLEIHAATFQEVTLLLSRAYTITQAGGTATGSPAAPDHR